jgi:hypothetical protein
MLERDPSSIDKTRYEYRLLATKKTATLQKELGEAGEQGFGFVGLTVAETAIALLAGIGQETAPPDERYLTW